MYSGIDAVQLADERELTAERAAVCEYELRLAREDIKNLQEKLTTLVEVTEDLSEPGVCLLHELVRIGVCFLAISHIMKFVFSCWSHLVYSCSFHDLCFKNLGY